MEPSDTARVAELLHERAQDRNPRRRGFRPRERAKDLKRDRFAAACAAETHHVVYRISDGDDPDWASWYADWLLDLSELPELLGERPVRSHLVHALVELDRAYARESPAERWEDWYATKLADCLGV